MNADGRILSLILAVLKRARQHAEEEEPGGKIDTSLTDILVVCKKQQYVINARDCTRQVERVKPGPCLGNRGRSLVEDIAGPWRTFTPRFLGGINVIQMFPADYITAVVFQQL